MSINYSKFPMAQGLNPWLALPVLVLFSAGCMILFSSIAVPLIHLLFGIGKSELYAIIENNNINEKEISALFIFQGLSSLGGFIAGPLLYSAVFEKHSLRDFLSPQHVKGISIWATAAIVLSFMGVNSLVIEWNANLDLPSFLDKFELWAREGELQAERLTRSMTTMPSTGHFIAALVVIAVLPAVGEELLFRGMIQNKLYAGMNNIHWAIWITGFLFGAIHGQFYGLFPRMFLGVLFGYLYYWSGSLLVAMLAHFVNNAFTLTMIYLFREKLIVFDIEQQEGVSGSAFLFSLSITAVLVWYFRNNHLKRYPMENES